MKLLRVYITILLFTFTSIVLADNSLSVNSSSGKPGEEIAVAVNLQNVGDVVAAEVTIPLVDQLSYVDGSCVLANDRVGQLATSVTCTSHSVKVLLYSSSLKAMPSSDGVLFSFKVKLGNDPAQYMIQPNTILSDAEGTQLPCDVKAGTITILAPKVACSVDAIQYGHVPIRDSYHQTFTINNTGTEPLQITALTSSNSIFSITHVLPFDIPVGGNEQIDVTYYPLSRGASESKITVASDAINGNQTISLSGEAYSVNELHLSSAQGSSDDVITLQLSVNNMESLSAVQCVIPLPEGLSYVDNSFTVSDRCSGMQKVVSDQDGNLKLYLYSLFDAAIAEGDGVIASFQLKLKGSSGDYTLQLQDVVLGDVGLENVASASYAGVATIASPCLQCPSQFDMQPCGMQDILQDSIAICNDGTALLTISRIDFVNAEDTDLASHFTILDTLPIGIKAGESAMLHVQCSPEQTTESYLADMQIYSNDPINNLSVIPITGTLYQSNTLSVSSSFSADGKTCNLSVCLQNDSDITGLQLNVFGLEDMQTTASDLHLTERCADFQKILARNGDGSLRIALFSMSNQPISDQTGEIFSVTLTSDTPLVTTREVTLSDIILGDVNSRNLVTELKASTTRHRIDLQMLVEDNVIDKTRVVFNEAETTDYDIGCDQAKFMSYEPVCQFYSLGSDGTEYSINERPVDSGIVPLGFYVSSSYTAENPLSLSIHTTRMESPVYIHDRLLDTWHALADGDYSFTSAGGTFNDRLELCTYLLGDADGNGHLSVADIAAIIAYLKGDIPAFFDAIAADVNQDNTISRDDIDAIISLLADERK